MAHWTAPERQVTPARPASPFGPPPLRLHGGDMPWLAPGFLVLTIVAAIFVATASYARTEKVRGTLVPSEGAISIASLRGGVVAKIHVREGEQVPAGSPLLTLAVDTSTEHGRLGERLAEAAVAQGEARDLQAAARAEMVERDREDIEVKRRRVAEDLRLARDQEQLVLQQVAMTENTLATGRSAHDSGFVSSVRYRQWETDVIQAKLSLIGVRQRIQTAERDAEQFAVAARRASAGLAEARAARDGARAEDVEKQLNLAGQRTVVLAAERAGRVASLDVRPGDVVAANQPMAVIVPDRSQIMAELWLPSQSVGFVREGNTVRLMLDSFPYQQFGMASGRVVAVSHAPTPRASSGGSDASGPLYRVLVTLDRQSVRAYGKDWSLTPGSTLSAVIILQRRSVLGWILEPLRRARGQFST